MKRKRDEEAKKNPGKQREVEKEDEEDGAEWSEDVQWTERGMEDYERSEAFKRRNKKAGKGRSCTISEKARDRLPTLDTFVQNQPASGKFPLKAVLETCFELSFPAEATKLFVEKVICMFSVLRCCFFRAANTGVNILVFGLRSSSVP